VLEWAWFLNAFGDDHIYKLMYGDKDAYALAFALAGKAHEYAHSAVPPAGVFAHESKLSWSPKREQMNKQGGWWLHALAHFDSEGRLLLLHRVTGEVSLERGTPVVRWLCM
jgi:hypothetical protein